MRVKNSVTMASLVVAADKFRDLSQAIDVPLLDATVAAFYGTGSKEEVRFSLFHSNAKAYITTQLFFNPRVRV